MGPPGSPNNLTTYTPTVLPTYLTSVYIRTYLFPNLRANAAARMWTRILRITCVMYIQYHSWHAESYLRGHGLWARGHGRGQTNRQHSNERSFLRCCASLSSQCSLAPLSLSLSFAAISCAAAPRHFSGHMRNRSCVFWWALYPSPFFFFFVWKISPDIYGFSFFFAFCVCLWALLCLLCLCFSPHSRLALTLVWRF